MNGGSGDSASVNKVEMTDSMSWGRVTGGAAFTGEANMNRVTISGGHVVSVAGAASVMGGLSNGGDVRENHVTIQNGQKGAEVEYSVMGGYTLRGNAAGNTVTVSDEILRDEEGTRVHGGLYGGLTEWGNADGNSVTVTNVILDGKNLTDVGNGTDAIYGGRTEHGDASGNTVTAENSVVYDRVYGGWAAGSNAEKNAVELAGETGAADTIVGGFSEDGAANGNQVVTALAGAELGVATVYGGYGASAEGNSILLNKGGGTALTVSHVYHMIGGYAVGGTADGNRLAIVSSTIEKTPAAGEENTNLLIAGGVGENGANKNRVLMGDADGSGSRSTVTGNYIYGGYTESGSASDNKIAAAHADLTLTEASKGLIGGWTDSGDAVSNEVQLSDSTLEANLLYGGGTKTGDARENTLLITGGADITVTYAIGGSTEAGAASDNEITLEGDGTELTADMLIGGWAAEGAASGNTVTLSGGSGSGDAVNNAVSVTGGTVETKTEGS